MSPETKFLTLVIRYVSTNAYEKTLAWSRVTVLGNSQFELFHPSCWLAGKEQRRDSE